MEQILASSITSDVALFRRWLEKIAEEGVPYHGAAKGQWIDLGRGASLSVLHPTSASTTNDGEDNNDSVVLKLGWGEVSFLLTGDIEASAEALLSKEQNLQSSVLKVAHHGSATSTTPDFLCEVRPMAAVISVGADNRFGHPAPEVLERLQGTLLFRTDQHGDVRLSTDGRRLWVETQYTGGRR